MRSFVSDYDLVVAKDLATALEYLAADEAWRPIAGGTDLMVLFNAGRLPFRRLVSIRDAAELRQIETSDDYLKIGAAVTYTQIRNNAFLRTDFPLLCQAASWTGGTANQNRGTIGGNIANASPAADSSPALLAYDAELELASSAGVRWLPYSQFHTGYKQMQLRPDELISRIRMPRSRQERVHYARKVGTRKAQAISKVCFAAVADRADGVMRNVRVAVGSVAPIPLRCFETERVLEGAMPSSSVRALAQAAITREIQPITDIRSTDEYRARVTTNLLHEFLENAR